MAFVKICDNDGKPLGGEVPFVQTKGSVSDQLESKDGVVSFRYLTNRQDDVHTFCNDKCEVEWREKQRLLKQFTTRP